MAVVCTTDMTGRAQSAYEPNSWHWSSDTYNGPYAEYLRVGVLRLVEQMLSPSFILIQSDRFGFGVSERGWF